MAVLLNGVAQLEYDRDVVLTEYQKAYLDTMDKKMDDGVTIDSKKVANPDINQRVQFVTANMINAMKEGNEGMVSALCTYVATRLPDLKQIKIDENNEEMTIDLVFDEDYKGQVKVTLM